LKSIFIYDIIVIIGRTEINQKGKINLKTKSSFGKAELYESAPISKAVIALAVPTVLSQLITVLYNMADTFFIGQLNDPSQVAAATISMPPFILLAGFANLFGIGGSSLISRSLGEGNLKRARSAAAFSIWGAGLVALAYGLLFLIFKPYVLPMFGTTATTYDYCFDYLFWTVTLGSVPTVLSACLAHLVRAVGYSRQAGVGIALGGIMNIVLDPIFIFAFGLDITGAAIATALSNVISLVYFIIVVIRIKSPSPVTADPRAISLKGGLAREVLSVGLASFITNIMAIVSNTVLNNLMSSYSDAATAGIGIAKKIDMMTLAVSIGMSQGVLSLIGYNYASKNYRRMYDAIKCAFKYLIIVSVATTLFLFFLAAPVSSVFIDDAETVAYAKYFMRVLCIICPMQAISLMCVTIMQAVGEKIRPLVASFARKGVFDVPLMLVMNILLGVYGIAWATPIAEVLSMVVAFVTFIPTLRMTRGLVGRSDIG
jgi:putative MATE family efflux protein